MKAIATLIQHHGWRSIAFLNVDNDFGFGDLYALCDAFQDEDVHSGIVFTSMIPSTALVQMWEKEGNYMK